MNEPRTYLILNGDTTTITAMNTPTRVLLDNAVVVDRFVTGQTHDRSADLNAIDNLAEWSRHHRGVHVLAYVHPDGAPYVVIATAMIGVPTVLVPLEDVEADAMHAGPVYAKADSVEAAA